VADFGWKVKLEKALPFIFLYLLAVSRKDKLLLRKLKKLEYLIIKNSAKGIGSYK